VQNTESALPFCQQPKWIETFVVELLEMRRLTEALATGCFRGSCAARTHLWKLGRLPVEKPLQRTREPVVF
jgi:hypothetical protein